MSSAVKGYNIIGEKDGEESVEISSQKEIRKPYV